MITLKDLPNDVKIEFNTDDVWSVCEDCLPKEKLDIITEDDLKAILYLIDTSNDKYVEGVNYDSIEVFINRYFYPEPDDTLVHKLHALVSNSITTDFGPIDVELFNKAKEFLVDEMIRKSWSKETKDLTWRVIHMLDAIQDKYIYS